jgi:hypothetical protein
MSTHPKAVVDGVIHHLSISQLQKLARCERKWWKSKVCGESEEQTNAQAYGTAAHNRLKHYLMLGEDVLDERERVGVQYLPNPGPHLTVEQTFGLDIEPKSPTFGQMLSPWYADGVPMTGDLDVFWSEGRVAYVGDHKTTSDVKARLKEAGDEVLADSAHEYGIQMLSYAYAVDQRFPGQFDEFDLQHWVYQSKGRPTFGHRHARVSRDYVLKAYRERIEPIAARAKVLAKAKVLTDATPNWDACGDYHRTCDYRSDCLKTLIKKEKQMGLMDMIKKQNITPAPVAPTQAQTATQPPAPAPTVSATPAPVAEPTVDKSSEYAQILPPDAPKSDPVAAAAAEAKTEEKPKRGRKPKAETIGSTPGGGTVIMVDGPALAETIIQTIDTGLASEKPRIRIWVDTVPNTATLDLDVYISKIVSDTAKAGGVDDLRFVTEKSHPFAYGNWKGALALAVRDNPPAPGDYFVRGGSEFTEIVLETLKPMTTPGDFSRGAR